MTSRPKKIADSKDIEPLLNLIASYVYEDQLAIASWSSKLGDKSANSFLPSKRGKNYQKLSNMKGLK